MVQHNPLMQCAGIHEREKNMLNKQDSRMLLKPGQIPFHLTILKFQSLVTM